VFHIEVNHVKSGIFFASKRNEIFASISNFASEAKVRAHPIDPIFSAIVMMFFPTSPWNGGFDGGDEVQAGSHTFLYLTL
jgi:hypothetical protein